MGGKLYNSTCGILESHDEETGWLGGGPFKLVRRLSRWCISPYRNQERVLQKPLHLDFDTFQQVKLAKITQSAAPLVLAAKNLPLPH